MGVIPGRLLSLAGSDEPRNIALSLVQPDTTVFAERLRPDKPRVVARRPAWQFALYVSQTILILSLALAAYSIVWEYSTRSYLRGFSDAVIPASATPMGKIGAILQWMSYGPGREPSEPADMFRDRDPSDTLNYTSLLRTCGSATNAFINLADTAGLSARRLLLRNSQGVVTHVVAEVLVGGRWIVVDPAFRRIMRGADGQPLTHEELMDPATLAFATRGLPGYQPEYNYQNTTHLHLSRLPLGDRAEKVLDRLFPGWDASPVISLIVERSSLATVVISVGIALLFGFLRILVILARRRERSVPPSGVPVQE